MEQLSSAGHGYPSSCSNKVRGEGLGADSLACGKLQTICQATHRTRPPSKNSMEALAALADIGGEGKDGGTLTGFLRKLH